jgi:hypothetical protein
MITKAHRSADPGWASQARLARLAARFSSQRPQLSFIREADRAFDWLDKAVAYHDTGLTEIAVDPLFANLHGDPRWLPFLRRIGKAPEQLAAIEFDVKLPQ